MLWSRIETHLADSVAPGRANTKMLFDHEMALPGNGG